MHVAVLSIDERGGSAAAATVLAVSTLSLDAYEDEFRYKADRSFVAMLWDNQLGVPLFVAKIADPTIIVACSAAQVLMIDLGMSVIFMATVIPILLDAKEGLSIDRYQASWLGSIMILCLPLGSMVSGPLVDWVGRKRALILVNVPYVLAWLLMHYAWNVPALLAANAMLGFASGIMEAPSVTYIGEISEPSMRGILSTLACTFASVGLCMVMLFSSLMPWRQAALVCMAAPLTTILLGLLTPIWLLSKGRRAEALRSLQYVRGWARKEAVAQEFQELETYHQLSQQCFVCMQKGIKPARPDCKHTRNNFITKTIHQIRYLLLAKETLRPFILFVAFFFVHTVCGLGPVRPNMVNVIRAFGMNDDPNRVGIMVGIISIISTILSAILVKLTGKRKLIILTMLGSAACVTGLSVYARENLSGEVSSYAPKTFPTELSDTPLVMFYLLVMFTMLGIPWMLLSEIFPFRSRGTASGLAAVCSYVMGFVVAKTNLTLESYLQLSGTYGLYAFFGYAGVVYLYLYLPETEGKTLIEIEKFYSGPLRFYADDPFINLFRGKKKEEKSIKEDEEFLPVVSISN